MRIYIDNLNKGLNTEVKVLDDDSKLLPTRIDQLGDGSYVITVEEFDPIRDIAEFHKKFGLEYHGKVRALTGELRRFRQDFMTEELLEYDGHAFAAEQELSISPQHRDRASYAYHLEEMMDALIDLVYVAIGTSYLHGFDFKEGWRRVQAANMAKVRAERAEDSKRGSTFDVIKPPGWVAPSHIDLVEVNDLMDVTKDEG